MPVNVTDDKIGWYIYLAEIAQTDAVRYESVQGARVLPIFKRLGENFHELRAIEGVEKKVRELVKHKKAEADAVLFEMLTGVLWIRNGWEVRFIPESSSERLPDLQAIKDGQEYSVECKRLAKSSEYSYNERMKWLRMAGRITNLCLKYNLLLDVNIHVELTSLPDNFLEEKLARKLPLIVQSGYVFNDDTWTVYVSFVDMPAIRHHLSTYSVKLNSPQLQELIGGRRISNRGFTAGSIVKHKRIGGGKGNNFFVTDLDRAFGIFWSCDAIEAINAKARDIKKQLTKACSQLPSGKNAAIHVGIETIDGPLVEKKRLEKITDTMNDFEIGDKNLNWLYCHFFQSYSNPDQEWVFDESLCRFKNMKYPNENPLTNTSLVVPHGSSEKNLLHWEKPAP